MEFMQGDTPFYVLTSVKMLYKEHPFYVERSTENETESSLRGKNIVAYLFKLLYRETDYEIVTTTSDSECHYEFYISETCFIVKYISQRFVRYPVLWKWPAHTSIYAKLRQDSRLGDRMSVCLVREYAEATNVA